MEHTKPYRQLVVNRFSSIPLSDWEMVVNHRNLYLSAAYLTALEESMVSEMDFFYAISYNTKDKPVLISVFQLVTFVDKTKGYSKNFLNHFHGTGVCGDDFSINVLVCGNVFANGENGFLYTNEISEKEAIEQSIGIGEKIKQDKATRKKLAITLFKEFWPSSNAYGDSLLKSNFREFKIDVNMVLAIHPKWENQQSYLDSMNAKFRTRANSVYKKSQELVFKPLSIKDIEIHAQQIKKLFNDVSSKSTYNLGKLNTNVFIAWKKELEDKFLINGVFLNDNLVGFSTAFLNNEVLEANYVGIDYAYNQEYCIYQLLLYKYVEEAIQLKVKELHLGRTSELVKSALGALPVDMKLYAKHKSPFTNVLMKPIFKAISPSKFELRKPFKANFQN